MTNLWLRKPRKGWRNDGGPIPYRLRDRVKRDKRYPNTVIIDNPLQRVRKGHWVVLAGGRLFAFSPHDVEHLYSRKPMPPPVPKSRRGKMSGIDEFAQAVEKFTESDKERQLRASRDSFRDGYNRLQSELADARSTIDELQKRIGELEAERDDLFEGLGDLNGWRSPRAKLDAIVAAGLEANDALDAAEQALTAERKRREELEHIATLTCDLDKPFGRAAVEQARVRYFSRHPSSSGNEPGNGRSG